MTKPSRVDVPQHPAEHPAEHLTAKYEDGPGASSAEYGTLPHARRLAQLIVRQPRMTLQIMRRHTRKSIDDLPKLI